MRDELEPGAHEDGSHEVERNEEGAKVWVGYVEGEGEIEVGEVG